MGISKVPNDEIAKQLSKVEILWNNFHKNIEEFKNLIQKNDKTNEVILGNIVSSVYNTNTI